eukprot:bmy_10809T0
MYSPSSSSMESTRSREVEDSKDVKPGEYVIKSLFAEFAVQAEKKIEVVMAEPLEKPLSRSLQRGEDLQFDQLISSMSSVAEHCLPSLLRTLFDWYRRQNGTEDESYEYRPRSSTKSKGDEQQRERDYLLERRDLAVDFIFCLVLVEVLKQIPVHPVPDPLVHEVLNLAFKHFKHKEGYSGTNTGNVHIIADLYAEVIGVLAQSKYTYTDVIHIWNKDPKMSRVALESLYRLLWVYVIRIKCESNTVTQSRLMSIVSALFPKGSRSVVPRDTPLNIFVKIIQFIAQECLFTILKGERKPKIDLFRTCIAAIPRLIPDGMSRTDLIELLARLTIHMDEELRALAFNTLQALMLDFPDWREDVLSGFVYFIVREVTDVHPTLLDNAVKMLVQLINQWKQATQMHNKNQDSQHGMVNGASHPPPLERSPYSNVFHVVEGFALVTLCSSRPATRRLAVSVLREIRALFALLEIPKGDDELAIDVMDRLSPSILESFIHLTGADQTTLLYCPSSIDLQTLAEWNSSPISHQFDVISPSHIWIFAHVTQGQDPWIISLSSFLKQENLPKHCPTAVSYAWMFAYTRLQLLSPQVDINSPINAKKVNTTTSSDSYMGLWRNYLLLCCSAATSTASSTSAGSVRCSPPETLASTPDSGYSIDSKNMKRRRRRDILRVQLVRIFELLADAGVISHSASGGLDSETHFLNNTLLEYVDLTRQLLEAENEKDSDTLKDIRCHFSALVANIIQNVPVHQRRSIFPQQSLRHSLFMLFSHWAGPFSIMFTPLDRYSDRNMQINRHQYCALKVHQLGCEAVTLLLELNPDQSNLMYWAVDRCYTGSKRVAAGCFKAIANVFQNRDCQCDTVMLLNLILFKAADSSRSIYEVAMQLLQILEPKMFRYAHKLEVQRTDGVLSQLSPLPHLYSVSYYQLSEELARAYPELTLAIFSEISQRIQTAHPAGRQVMLHYLLPWMNNIELVDLKPLPTARRHDEDEDDSLKDRELMVTSRRWLRGEGWGSPQATAMVLNNLMYMTAKVKKVIVYLGRDKTMQLLEELVSELQLTDPVSSGVTHMDNPPYYRITSSYKIPSVTSGTTSSSNTMVAPTDGNPDNKPIKENIEERCNIAVILLTDLIIDHSVKVEWGSYLHLLLHAIFIGFDHCHPEVYEHCKRLLLHLLIVMGSNSNIRTVASVLLRNKEFNEPRVLTVKQIAHLDYTFTGVSDFIPDYQPSPMTDSGLSSSSTSSSISLGNNSAAISHLHTTVLSEVDISVEQDGKVKTLMEFITSRKRGPLWNHEDVSAKNPSIKSAEQLTTFLKHVVSVFKQSSSEGIHLEHHLSEVALQTALSCSSRHYAGRSFQIFRALKQPLSATTLSDVLSRLVETVGDPGEDAQGFVIELLLTLESAIDTLAETMKHYDLLSALSQTSYHDPIMGNKYAANRKSTGQLNLSTSPINSSSYLGYSSNARSNSLRLSLIGDRRGDRRRSNTLDIMDGRLNHSSSLARTRSLSSLREKAVYDVQPTTEPASLMATIFWIAASLLESDYEYEYLLALRLLNKLLTHLPLEKSESREKIETVQSKLKWNNFPGLQQLFLKGFTSVSTQEMTVHLLSKLIAVSKHTLVDPSQLSGFPLNILCLLPHLIQHFDSPTQFCKETASRIAKSPYWKEALNILKLVVSRSASLVVPNDIPRTYGGDTGSPEISFTKIFNNVSKELPGKTLDFHFDISETPIIGNKYGDQHSAAGRNGKPKVIAVTRSTSSTSSGSNSNALVPVSWKRPQLSQVVFSSNEDLEVGDQQTSLISATEDIIQEEEVAVEDNSSEQQFGVFKDFDFLDVELEDAELNNDSAADETMPDQPDLLLQSQDSTGSISAEEVLQIRDETPSLEASLDNANSQLPEDTSSVLKEEQVLTAFEDEGSYIIQEQQDSLVCQGILDLEETDMPEPSAPESYPGSVCEEDVTLALKELDERCEEEEADFSGLSSQDEEEQDGFPEAQTSPLPSPFLSAIIAAFQPVAYDDEEEAWRCHVNQMLSDTDGSCAVFTFHVFSRLFQSIQRKFGDITNEAVSFLGESLQRIGTKFKSSLEVMMMCSECPTVFVDAETLMSCDLLETLKFSVLELQEHLDTYSAKREAAEQWLDNCKRTFGAKEDMYRINTDAQELELCRRLYKLHFQLLLLFQAYCKLINQVNTIKNEAEVFNMSEELAQLESILKEAESASENEEIDISKAAQTTIETAIHTLIETLKNKEFISAVAQVKAFRSLWPNDIFGSCEDDPVQTLLHIYFHHQTLGQTGSFAVIGSDLDMSEANYKLMELNLEIRESLRMVQSYQLLAQAKPIGNLVSTGF